MVVSALPIDGPDMAMPEKSFPIAKYIRALLMAGIESGIVSDNNGFDVVPGT
jgi:hypothetical protein